MSNSNTKPYIFISYAHANSDKVLPTVAAMKKSGINLWYDEGIVAGSEWPEFIAEKVVDCHKFVLFVSDAYLNSQNCKRELNFAISRKKNILTIFLEDVKLSPGVEMQLGTYQAIYRNRFLSDGAFWDSLCKEPFFDDCRELNNPSIQNPAPNAQTPQRPPVNPTINPTPNPAFNTNGFNTPKPTASINQLFPQSSTKNKTIAALLAIFLGGFGIHYFYLGDKLKGIIFILIGVASSLLIGVSVSAIIGLIQGIIFLFTNEEKFQQKYVSKKTR